MSSRKKNAVIPRQGKNNKSQYESKAGTGAPEPLSLHIAALLKVGTESVVIDCAEHSSSFFMAEFIEPA